MSLEFDMLTSYAFLRIDSESQMPLRFDFLRIPSSIPILSRTRLNAAKIVNCVYNFLLRYSGTFLSSVKIYCCVCLHFASLVLVRYLIP